MWLYGAPATHDTFGVNIMSHPDLDAGMELLTFLMTKPKVRLVGQRCSQRRIVAETGGMEGYRPSGEMMRCSRPVWGDGAGITTGEGMIGEGLCSRCLHEYVAFHAPYTTLQANPAASALSGTSILRRTDIFGRRGDALPEVGAERADVFPAWWQGPDGDMDH